MRLDQSKQAIEDAQERGASKDELQELVNLSPFPKKGYSFEKAKEEFYIIFVSPVAVPYWLHKNCVLHLAKKVLFSPLVQKRDPDFFFQTEAMKAAADEVKKAGC